MSIIVVCPNGHSLSVRDACAGKQGLCPVCRAQVTVPQPADSSLSDDDIMGLLGPHDPNRSRGFTAYEPEMARATTSVHFAAKKVIVSGEKGGAPMKSCEKCSAEISATTHICPHCHTYVGGRAGLA